MLRSSSKFNFVSPGGSQVTIDSPEPFAIETMASDIRFAGSSYSRSFQIGGRGYHDGAQHGLMKNGTLVARLLTADHREVRVSRSEDQNLTIASLIGEYHEVTTGFFGPAPADSRILATFETVQIVDSPEGMTVTPRSGLMVSTVSEAMVLICADLGVLNISPVTPSAVPSWAGTRTAHGHLWRTEGGEDRAAGPAARRPDYLLGLSTVTAGIIPAKTGASDDSLLDWADGLQIQWRGRS
jgi:hypothetical protein